VTSDVPAQAGAIAFGVQTAGGQVPSTWQMSSSARWRDDLAATAQLDLSNDA
jgi:hypothetical protein